MRRASIGNLIKAIYDPNKPDDFVEDPDVSVLTGEKRRTKSSVQSLIVLLNTTYNFISQLCLRRYFKEQNS